MLRSNIISRIFRYFLLFCKFAILSIHTNFTRNHLFETIAWELLLVYCRFGVLYLSERYCKTIRSLRKSNLFCENFFCICTKVRLCICRDFSCKRTKPTMGFVLNSRQLQYLQNFQSLRILIITSTHQKSLQLIRHIKYNNQLNHL